MESQLTKNLLQTSRSKKVRTTSR